MPTAADLGALFSIGPTLRRTIWGINGNSDVGRKKKNIILHYFFK